MSKNNFVPIRQSADIETDYKSMERKRGSLTEAEQNQLIVQHMPLVAACAQKYRGGKAPFEELLASGREGLVAAARTYDAGRGVFHARAGRVIEDYLIAFIRSYSSPSQFFPGEEGQTVPPLEGDKIERIYFWASWGQFGSALAISEAWSSLDATPEDLADAHDLIRERRERFAAAFISLTSIQRKLVRAVYLTEPSVPLAQAARDIEPQGISYWRAVRELKKALKTMREVIKRADDNEKHRSTPASAACSVA